MNVDGGVGNVEMIGKHFHSFTFFRDVIFKHRYIILVFYHSVVIINSNLQRLSQKKIEQVPKQTITAPLAIC